MSQDSFAPWIGVIQLPPLPGSSRADGEPPDSILQEAGLVAIQEAETFAQAGYDGVLLENTGDFPYLFGPPVETLASMAVIAAAVREVVSVQVGIRLKSQGSTSALAIAAVTGCDFIPVSVILPISLEGEEETLGRLARERIRLQSPVVLLPEFCLSHSHEWTGCDWYSIFERLASFSSLFPGVIFPRSFLAQIGGGRGLSQISVWAKKSGVPIFLQDLLLSEIEEFRSDMGGLIVGSGLRKTTRSQSDLDTKKVREYIQLLRRKKFPKIKK